MTPRIYPMSPIIAWCGFSGCDFTMYLVKRVERLGREVAAACSLGGPS
jgi:hypothetical protein